MRTTRLEITNYIGKGMTKHMLSEPWIPDGCADCGIFKGSPFETRIMHLIFYHSDGSDDSSGSRFLCERCYLEAFENDVGHLIME